MALQLNVTTGSGVSAPKAYARVGRISFDPVANKLDAQVFFYISADARKEKKAPLFVKSYHGIPGKNDCPAVDSSNAGLRAAVYGWLKKLAEFKNSTNV